MFGATAAWGQVAISAIQGEGTSSPLTGQVVTTSGIVTGFYFSSGTTRNGFWIQTADGLTDGNDATSEAVFISDTAAPTGLAVGDAVTIRGTVGENGGLTQMTAVTVLARTPGQALPAPVSITLPFASATAPERYECMRATAPQPLAVTESFQLGSQGLFHVALGGPLRQPTDVVAPGAAAQAMQAANDLARLLIDDGSSGTYPKPTPFLFGASASEATLRLGDTVTGVTGVFSWFGSAWGFVPTVTPTFARPAPRPAVPAVGGRLRVAGANVLNYFNGDGVGGGFPTSRGAGSATEFARQRTHLVTALNALGADVLALTEVENDGFGTASAIRDLVNGLDAAAGATAVYAFVTYTGTGTDLITNALVYRVATVEPAGAAASLSSSTFERLPLAQTFRERATGAKFTVCVNHFRAKASGGAGLNADQGDGQGGYNLRRTQQAQALATWLAGAPTGDADSDVLILGDLNSYTREDPITALTVAGYVSLPDRAGLGDAESAYSYVFSGQAGALDHAMASAALVSQVAGAAVWHNNAAEPPFLDYNVENKNSAQQAINDGATPWRASDHDPLLVGLNLTRPPQAYAQWAAWNLPAGGGSGATSAPEDDADRDGRSNLLAYALGGGVASVPGPRFEANPVGTQEFLFERPAWVTGVVYGVERSADLAAWTPVPETQISREPLADGERWRVALPADGPRLFARLRVTLE